jgi:hypothetical protein
MSSYYSVIYGLLLIFITKHHLLSYYHISKSFSGLLSNYLIDVIHGERCPMLLFK